MDEFQAQVDAMPGAGKPTAHAARPVMPLTMRFAAYLARRYMRKHGLYRVDIWGARSLGITGYHSAGRPDPIQAAADEVADEMGLDRRGVPPSGA